MRSSSTSESTPGAKAAMREFTAAEKDKVDKTLTKPRRPADQGSGR